MKNTFNFYYYGIKIKTITNNILFFELISKKFNDFKKNNTKNIFNKNSNIIFKQVKSFKINNLDTKISNNISISKNKVLIKKYYLDAKYIVFIENKDRIDISIEYKPSLKFLILNILSRNILEKQLFQNIIKENVEQILLNLITNKKSMECLHASAVEKDGKAILFVGLNGVGKSTLAQYLIEKHNFNYFGDNYILIDKNMALKSPDVVRLSKESLSYLGKNINERYGFDKYFVDTNSKSQLNQASIDSIYLVSRGNKYEKTVATSELLNAIIKLQTIESENVTFSKLALLLSNKNDLILSTKIKFYELNINSFKDLEIFSYEL